MIAMTHWLRLMIAAVFLPAAGPAAAQDGQRVDVQLVLAVDISVSMSKDELEIQRRGYASALTDPQVLEAITSGSYGRIAISYFEWAGVTSQRLVVPWTIIAGREDAQAVVDRISVPPAWQSRKTSISGALVFAADLMEKSPFKGIKRVIDVSGDGANNEGPPLAPTRDRVAASGITINGLPVMTQAADLKPYEVPDLDHYFGECVIGGPGAFVMPVVGWEQFPEAIRRKLLLELARQPAVAPEPARIILAQAKPDYDCLIGERLWREDGRQHMYNPENEPKHRNRR